jgi:oligopeptide/dipeptide ABC transporter ATP-binding protein
MNDPLLRIEDLRVWFGTRTSDVRAVNGVDLDIHPGEVVGLVGASGSGKSVTARAIMRLVPMPPGRLVSGRILFDGIDLTALPEREMESLRGSRIAMIFQDPMTFLNPLITAGDQVAEAIRRHQGLDRRAARGEVITLFRKVGIPSPEMRYRAYPHQLSGGLRQRVMIAMALSSRPEMIVAGALPNALAPPSGCRFRTRCPFAAERCAREVPPLRELAAGHWVACHYAEELAGSPQPAPAG